MHSSSPNASVAVTVVAGGPSGASTISTTASTAAATATSGGVGVTRLCLMSVCLMTPGVEVDLTAGAVGVTVGAETIIAPLGAVVGGSCSRFRISPRPPRPAIVQPRLPFTSTFPFSQASTPSGPFLASPSRIPTYQEQPDQQRPRDQGCAFQCAGRACP
jgi:hypothetical protein